MANIQIITLSEKSSKICALGIRVSHDNVSHYLRRVKRREEFSADDTLALLSYLLRNKKLKGTNVRIGLDKNILTALCLTAHLLIESGYLDTEGHILRVD